MGKSQIVANSAEFAAALDAAMAADDAAYAARQSRKRDKSAGAAAAGAARISGYEDHLHDLRDVIREQTTLALPDELKRAQPELSEGKVAAAAAVATAPSAKGPSAADMEAILRDLMLPADAPAGASDSPQSAQASDQPRPADASSSASSDAREPNDLSSDQRLQKDVSRLLSSVGQRSA